MSSDVARTLTLSLARVIEPTLAPSNASITSLDIDSTGEFAVAAVDDDSLRLLSIDKGCESHTVLAKSAGCALARFTHHKNAVLFASTKNMPSKHSNNQPINESNYPIHYLSLYDDRYLRHFHGHNTPLRSLSMSPVDDSFMSAAGSFNQSIDNSVRFWDLRSNVCSSRVDVPASQTHISLDPAPLACYDPQGLIFAIASHSSAIRLFDVRSTASGPFTTFTLDRSINQSTNQSNNQSAMFTILKFSPDGQSLLVGSNSGKLSLIDAFDGQIKQSFESTMKVNQFDAKISQSDANTGKTQSVNQSINQSDASYSADGQFIFAGSDDGKVHVYRATDTPDDQSTNQSINQSTNQSTNRIPKEPVAVWNAHTKPIRAIAASHTRQCVITAAHEFGLWLPRPD